MNAFRKPFVLQRLQDKMKRNYTLLRIRLGW